MGNKQPKSRVSQLVDSDSLSPVSAAASLPLFHLSFGSDFFIQQHNTLICRCKPKISPCNFLKQQTMTISSNDSSVDSYKSALVTLAPLEAVLFDVDGTLCDSDPLHYYAFLEMLQEIGFNGGVPIDEEFFIQNIAGKHNDDVARILFPDDFERGLKFMEDKEAYFRKLVKEKVKPIDGLYKVTKWIEERGLKRAAVTNAPRANAELMISMLGLTEFFQAVIIGSECEHAKPHPEPYLKGLEAIKASKEHTMIFEDSVSGIKAGVAAGMPVVGLTTRNPEHLLVEAKPAFLIRDYADPKLWAALEELDNKGGKADNVA